MNTLRRLGLDSNGRRATASFRGARKLAYSAVGRGVRTCKDPRMPGYGVPPGVLMSSFARFVLLFLLELAT